MRLRSLFLLITMLGCSSEGPRATTGETLFIDERLVLVANGTVGDRVDFVVIRDFDPEDAAGLANDRRLLEEENATYLVLPDGEKKDIRGSGSLFYLEENSLEVHPLSLHQSDLSLIQEGGPYDSIAELIEELVRRSNMYAAP